MASDRIVVRGAREHNLKNIDVEIPRDQLVVITGLSGSGKSSLAFDTIYAEGQRRYVESLSAYARQFLEQMEKPEVDSIEGLSPAISIEQKTTSKNPRSTVGTVTEIYDYLRVLFARVGIPHCPELRPGDLRADRAADGRSRADAAGRHAAAGAGAGDPRTQGRVQEALLRPAASGLLPRARERHDPRPRARRSTSTRKRKHTIEVVVDRLIVRDNLGPRLADSLETALRLADGIVQVEPLAERSADSSTDGREGSTSSRDLTRRGRARSDGRQAVHANSRVGDSRLAGTASGGVWGERNAPPSQTIKGAVQPSNPRAW